MQTAIREFGRLFIWFLFCSLECDGVRYPRTSFVMHTHDSPGVNKVVQLSKDTWLKDTNYVIVTGVDKFDHQHPHDPQHRSLTGLNIEYNGNPGCALDDVNCNNSVVSHTRLRHYYGGHRTLAGVLVANETYAPDWIHIFDDDNFINIPAVQAVLTRLDPSVPLLLTGLVGPSIPNTVGPNSTYEVPPIKKCRISSTPTEWSCCLDTSKPCIAHVPPPSTQEKDGQKAGIYIYDEKTDNMVLKRYCGDDEISPWCCRTGRWPEKKFQGYPYKLDRQGSYCPHFAAMWPYGGSTYIISRGMLAAIGHDKWEECVYRFQCGNADVRVMQCLFNNGFSIHQISIPGIAHHIRSVEDMMKKSGERKKIRG